VQLIVTNHGKQAIGAGGWAGLVTPRVDLFTAFAGILGPDTVIGSLTLAAYVGYPGPITPTISAQYVSQPSGLPAVDISDAVFTGPTAPNPGVNAIGYVFTDNAGTRNIYAIALFDGPVSLNVPLDQVTVDGTLLLNCGLQVQLST
jgi:hypothetical protein